MNNINFPCDFMTECKTVIGADFDKFIHSLSEDAAVSIRLNLHKSNKLLSEYNLETVPWCNTGKYLKNRPVFTLDPLFHAGTYYVQEASSMFIKQALSQYAKRASVVLDMCAAPGGKSNIISDFLGEDGFLVSNEFIPKRANILVENIIKWGNPNVVVTNSAPSHFEQFKALFDVVAVDAPCSGEGMFRKDSQAIEEWSLDNVKKCVLRQREILTSAWKALKPGGILIYSTCTYNHHENEQQVKWLSGEFGAEYLPLKLEEQWHITETEFGYRFFPHRTKGEGFFLSVVRKRGDSSHSCKIKISSKTFEKNDKLLSWICTRNIQYKTLYHKDVLYAVPDNRYELALLMINKLNVLILGIPIASIKGRIEIPHAGLALSINYNMGAFPMRDVNYEQAITFLRSETLFLADAPRGYILINYKGIPLGWVKNVGNRCNNMYPEYWRIRMSLGK